MDEPQGMAASGNTPKRLVKWMFWAGLAVTALTLLAVFMVTRMRQAQSERLPVLSQLPDFTLTNQQGKVITLADLRGQVWVADIVFTRCAGPCPKMTQRMSQLQTVLPADALVKLVTLTTDPDFDSPAVMRRYGERFGADFNRWMFLTGGKPQIRRLAVDGLKLVAIEKPAAEQTSPEDLFIHSTIFVVVDKQGRLRDAFDSTEPGFKARVAKTVNQLVGEQAVE